MSEENKPKEMTIGDLPEFKEIQKQISNPDSEFWREQRERIEAIQRGIHEKLLENPN